MIRRVCILGACLALLPVVSQAAIMIMVEGVTGPNKPAPYTGWFVGDGFAWSSERSNPAKPFELSVSLAQSGTGFASLAQAAFGGALMTRIVIDNLGVNDAGSPALLSRLTCEGAVIRDMSTSGDADDAPNVELAFTCARFTTEHFEVDSKTGAAKALKGSWNFKTNTP